ncbi:hypothetical protein DL98DRAFT_588607 [Cadophora sp. DSE1049]|nr:hypothetical protein DL98DRAFT_588607 [Cadophora sp. DSE1049]
MSMLDQDSQIPAGEQWTGSPAQYRSLSYDVGNMRKTRTSQARLVTMILSMGLSSTFILPIIYFAPQIPTMLLFEYVNFPGGGWYVQTAIVCVPAAIMYMLLVLVELIFLKSMVLGRVVEYSYRTISVYFYLKWFVYRLMDISLVVLQPVYATLYVVPFLRCLGVKVGHGAEVSTARGINFELTEIGERSFVADRVTIGNAEVRNNIVTQRRTQLYKRAFLGNGAMVPQGTELASNTLVGVLPIAPDTPLMEGQSYFGSPTVIMPARQCRAVNRSEQVLFSPPLKLRALRLLIEGLRIFLPLFAIPFTFIPIILKWILIGCYHQAEWPLWSLNIWKSKPVTSVFETLSPFCLDMLTGTPFITWFFRAMGVQIGHHTRLLSSDITEYDMVSIGDEAVLNRHAGPQTHLFEGRIMKVARVDIEDRGYMKA